MIFKNIELFNVGALIPAEGGGYHISRIPQDVREHMTPHGQEVALCPAGVEIRFVINSGTAKIKLRSNNKRKFIVYYGALNRGADPNVDYYGPDETTVEIVSNPCADKCAALTKMCGYSFDPNVVRILLDPFGHDIIVDVEGDVRPPLPEETPEKRFIMYGSSITHGCFAMAQNNTYVYQISRKLGYDVYNFGFGGSCMLEKEVCDYLSENGTEKNDRKWDFAVMELGINTLTAMDHKEFARRAKYLLDVMRDKNPTTKFFVTDIYPHLGEIDDNGVTKERRNALRRQLDGRDNIIFVPGSEILTDWSGLCTDGVHPNVEGIREIADNWYKIIKANI